jgi:mannose-6-phosphate isomerase
MPVRAAMACTKYPMSVQIHPNNEYALAHDGKIGKPDGVYIIEGEGTVEFGHYAKTREEFKNMVNEKAWNSLLRYINVKAGDFLNMPHGTLHALGSNMIYFEFSQNADLTYRLYDYDRKGIDPKTGKLREMNAEKVIECVNIPDSESKVEKLKKFEKDGCILTSFHSEPGVYSCGKIEVAKKGIYERDQFYFLTCIDGEGTVDGVGIKGGETLFVPCEYGQVTLEGNFNLTYVTYIKL